MKSVTLGFLLAVLTLVAATGLGLAVIHITDFPYTADIVNLGIEEASGLPRGEIMANYDAVMEFLSPFKSIPFHLPTLEYSATGAQHFVDCKVIFNGVYMASAIALLGAICLFAVKAVKRRVLKFAGIFTIAIPLVFALLLAIDFNRMFVLFHGLFFEGETWIFDAAVDRIITILPADFFMHCALFIAVFWVLGGVLELFFGLRGTKGLERKS